MQQKINLRLRFVVAAMALLVSLSLHAQKNILQPTDPITASSANSPGSEGVANAIDGKPTKYLNFDKLNTGFTVTPSVGATLVSEITLTSANDGPERDPASYLLEGANDGKTFVKIAEGAVATFATRFEKQSITLSNNFAYRAYRLTFPTVANEGTANSMQISEVELLGVLAPADVTQPGDTIAGTSANTPGSEGVANAIDNQPTKYLNFDKLNTGFTVTPSVGGTIVTGLGLTSANDAIERDPASFRLEGSLDATAFVTIAEGSIPAFASRFQEQIFFFPNTRSFTSYRIVFPTVSNEGTANSMQISEVQFLGVTAPAPSDVTQPGDTIVGSSSNTPGSEGVANSIDNQPTKYLNFDKLNTGFTVTPAVGQTVLKGISLTSANDGIERDPASYKLEGSNDGTNFVTVAEGSVPAFATRFQKQVLFFENIAGYTSYRITFPTVANAGTANSMQISEVEFLGFLAPRDVTQPGDAITGTSANTPGSEGVANAIDDKPTKYLNFDKLNTGFTVTPSVGATIVSGISLTSANDGIERDPASYTLEGSQDGTTFELISSGTVAAFPARFSKQYIWFANRNAYRVYRIIFPTVANAGTANSMQISEVELLGEAPGGGGGRREDLIKFQPESQPVLLGSQATFGVNVTGPWAIQWYKNDVPIAGARSLTYTTPAVTSTNGNDVYRAEVSGKGGTQLSDPAKIVIFTPAATKSIGMSWEGGGANGAPTPVLTNDIAGFHLQAYWNNIADPTGDLPNLNVDPVQPVKDSDNNDSTVTIHWESSGEWGVGTGADSPTRRILNGIMTRTGDPAGVSFVQFAGVPPGNHSLIVYTVQVPLEFFQMDFEVATTTAAGTPVSKKAYVRPQNADEYNAAPGYVRVVGATPSARGVGNMIRFDNVSPGPDGLVTLNFSAPDWFQPAGAEPRRGPGVNALQLLLNTGTVPQPPDITSQPVSANAVLGSGVQLSAVATGEGVQFQWLKNGFPIFGATSSTLNICADSTNDAGRYRVAISNPAGRFLSSEAVVAVLPTASLTEGISTHLKFDETTGLSAANAVTGGSPGALKGFADNTSHWKTGKLGRGVQFDAVGTYVLVPNYTKPADGMTVSAWINPDASQAYGPIVNNWIGAGRPIGNKGQFFLRANQNPNTGGTDIIGVVAIGPNEPTVLAALPALTPGWHQVVMTADGAAVKIYVDGQVVGSTDYFGKINTPNFNWLSVGGDLVLTDVDGNPVTDPIPNAAATAQGIFAGMIDDVALWARSLSAPEVASLFAGGNQAKTVEDIASVLNTTPCQGQAPTIGISQAGGTTSVTFAGGVLESAPSVNGPFTPVTGAANPYTVNTGQAKLLFYRVRGQ